MYTPPVTHIKASLTLIKEKKSPSEIERLPLEAKYDTLSRWRIAKEHLTVLSSLCQHRGLVHGTDMKRRIKVFLTSMIGF